MVNLAGIVKDARKTGELSELVPFAEFIGERVFLTKGGDPGVLLQLSGADYECLDHAQLDQTARRFEAAVRVFGEPFRVYQFIAKRNGAVVPHLSYPDPVLQAAIDGRAAFLASKSDKLYALDVHFVVLFEGWRHTTSARGVNRLVRMFSAKKSAGYLQTEISNAAATLQTQVDAFTVHIQDVIRIRQLAKPGVFAFFRRLLNYTPAKAECGELRYDRHLDYFSADSVLECERDHLRLDDHYVKVLTLKETPARTYANMFRALLAIPSNYILVSEWKEQPNARTRRDINSRRRHHHNSKRSLVSYVSTAATADPRATLYDPSKESEVDELGGGLKVLQSGNYFGGYSLTVILYGPTLAAARSAAAETMKVFSAHGAVLTKERYNQLNAWLAALPGKALYSGPAFDVLYVAWKTLEPAVFSAKYPAVPKANGAFATYLLDHDYNLFPAIEASRNQAARKRSLAPLCAAVGDGVAP